MDLYLVFPARLEHDHKCFIRIPSLNFPEMRSSGTFSQFYQMIAMETMTVYKKLSSVYAMHFQVL